MLQFLATTLVIGPSSASCFLDKMSVLGRKIGSSSSSELMALFGLENSPWSVVRLIVIDINANNANMMSLGLIGAALRYVAMWRSCARRESCLCDE